MNPPSSSSQNDGASPNVVHPHSSSSGHGRRHRRVSTSHPSRGNHISSTSEPSLVPPHAIRQLQPTVPSTLQMPFDQNMSPKARLRFLSSVIAACRPEELLFMSETIAPLLKRDFIYQLPQELVLHVLSYIDEPKDLMRASLVSKYWFRIIRDESIWKRMCYVFGFDDWEAEKQRSERECARRCQEKGKIKQMQSDPLSDDDPGVLSADADEKGKNTHHHQCQHHHRKFSFRRHFRDSFIIRMNWRNGGKLLKCHKLPIVAPDTGTVTSISLDSESIVVGFANSMIKIFSVRTGVLCRTLVGHKSGVWCVCLVSQGGHRDPEPGDERHASMSLQQTTSSPTLPSPQTRRSSTYSPPPPIIQGSSSEPRGHSKPPRPRKKSKESKEKDPSGTHSKKPKEFDEKESSTTHSKKSSSSHEKDRAHEKDREKGKKKTAEVSISEGVSNLNINATQGDITLNLSSPEKAKEKGKKRSTANISERVSNLSIHETEGDITVTSPDIAQSPQVPTPSGSRSARSATTLDLNERKGVNKILPFQSQEHLISPSMQRMLGIDPHDSDRTSSGEDESSNSSSSEAINKTPFNIDKSRRRRQRPAGAMRVDEPRFHDHHRHQQFHAEDYDEPNNTRRMALHAPGSSRGWGQPNAIIVSGGCDKTVRVWDAVSGQCIYILHGHTSTIRAMRVLHNRPIAVTGSRDSTVRVWDIQLGRCLRVLEGHLLSVRCLDVHGNKVVSGSYDNTCRLWNIDTGECLHVLIGHYHQVYTVAFDGVRVVSGGLDTTVRVWDAETGHCVALLQGHSALVCEIQLSPTILATGGSDGRVITFSLDTYEVLYRLVPHESSVTSLQLDENFLVTGGNDGRVKLYETQTGEYIRDLTDSSDNVWKVAFGKETVSIMCRRGAKTVVEIWNLGTKSGKKRHHHDREVMSPNQVKLQKGDGAGTS